MRVLKGHALTVGVLATVTTACAGGGSGESQATPAPTVPSNAPRAMRTPFPYSTEPVAFEPGTYQISRSEWSLRDFTVTFPEDWTVQYGHVYAKQPDSDDEFGFYPVVVDAIYTDACEGDGVLKDVGPSVSDLAEALLEQSGPATSGPVDTTLGNYPATRIDFQVPDGLGVENCRLQGAGLQIWYSPPADKYFVLLPDGRASAYILDVGGQRQVFLTQYRSATSDEDLAELEGILDSIRIGT